MSEGDMLATTLTDIRRRLADLQGEYDRISEELAKLRLAERSLAAIVEGTPLPETVAAMEDGVPRAGRGRGSRGPRANSAKGRLRALLESAGPTGLSQAEIARRLPDVAPNTLASYLSVMVSSGEALRKGDFVTAVTGPRPAPDTPQDEHEDDDDAQPDDRDA
ncbi:hypothetical protein [Methylorubrum salsuginis]|uniref:Uncharacterized protein n=1 Tax=Methylorubrum salsuginis TaxID=414703 RepID=A0A1I3Z6X3_9HYPH|nr:hypothetical protein [Methylorubrum salsuginis]SFK39785.1 hypothetical protein SAMN04488125_101546 [Methylorubrum salsuginis]